MSRPSHGWCSGILRSYWILSVYHMSSFSTITSFNSPACIFIHSHLKMFRLHVKHPRKEARETHMRALAWTVGIYGAYREYSFILREGKGTDVSRFGKCYALDITNEMSKKKKVSIGNWYLYSQKSHQQMITNDRKSILPGRFKSPLDLLDLGTES